MIVLRMVVAMLFFVLSELLFGQEAAHSSQGSARCRLDSLPSPIQNRLQEQYGSWKIQEPADLSPHAHERWEAEKPLACPGIASGHFESTKTPSYAILLVPAEHADKSYRLLVFNREPGKPGYANNLIEKSDEQGASNYFIHNTPISKFFDEQSRKKFQAHAPDGILVLESAENEYGVEVYFWSGGRYRHEPVDH